MTWLVLSHPYDAQTRESNEYEVFRITTEGRLAPTGHRFEMGRARMTEIAFSPINRTGIVPQEDGTLGVFRLEEDGRPRVVHASYRGAFWAFAVVTRADGRGAYVLDAQWEEHGGGIYEVSISDQGQIVGERLVARAQLPYAMKLAPNGRAVLGAHHLLGSPEGCTAHLLELAAKPRLLASAPAFDGDTKDVIISALSITCDGRFALLADSNAFSSAPNRIGVVAIGDTSLRPVQTLAPVEDPTAIVSSPLGGPVLVTSGFGNTLIAIDYHPEEATPFSLRGELPYAGIEPALPAAAARVGNRVFVTENGGVRCIEMVPSGDGIVDCGLHRTETAVGAIGALFDSSHHV